MVTSQEILVPVLVIIILSIVLVVKGKVSLIRDSVIILVTAFIVFGVNLMLDGVFLLFTEMVVFYFYFSISNKLRYGIDENKKISER